LSSAASIRKEMTFEADPGRKRWEFVSEPITAEVRFARAEAPATPAIPASQALRLDGRFDASVLSAETSAGNSPATGTTTGADRLAVVDKGPGVPGPSVHFSLMTTAAMTAADLRRYIDQGPLRSTVETKLRVITHKDLATAASGMAGAGPAAVFAAQALRDQASDSLFGERDPEAIRRVEVDLRFAPSTRQLVMWVAARVLAQMKARGLHVGNTSVGAQAWNTILDNTTRRVVGTSANDVWCQECMRIGEDLTRPLADDLFGVDEYYLGDVQTSRPGRIADANHVANLLIAPDGSRYVVDYWMGLSLDRPMVFDSLTRWLDNAAQRVWDLRGYRQQLTVEYPEAMNRVAQAVLARGQEAGREMILQEKLGGSDKRKEVLLRSYQQSPWKQRT